MGEDYIEAYVPVTLLGLLSEQPGVLRVREIVPPQPGQSSQSIAGHGPRVHGSPTWNRAGYSGQGIEVGVIDLGFESFRQFMGTELPATVEARCYTDVGLFTENLADCEVDSDHGTMVAESLLDVAPGGVPVYSPAKIMGRLAGRCRLDGIGGCICHQPLNRLAF